MDTVKVALILRSINELLANDPGIDRFTLMELVVDKLATCLHTRIQKEEFIKRLEYCTVQCNPTLFTEKW